MRDTLNWKKSNISFTVNSYEKCILRKEFMTAQEENEITQVIAGQTKVPKRFIGALADEVAKIVIQRLPTMSKRAETKKKKAVKKKEIEDGIFLDTSAIIDGRIFDVVDLGLLHGTLVVPEFILGELKHIADSQDMVKRERGQRGLARLEKIRKTRLMKFQLLNEEPKTKKDTMVDDRLILLTKKHKGRVVTCDYNLEKKSAISGVVAVNVHELANRLKVLAVPGEALHITLQHVGKDPTQGVGYLEDGTMIVVEHSNDDVGQSVDVIVTRVIQTSSGRILFAKKI